MLTLEKILQRLLQIQGVFKRKPFFYKKPCIIIRNETEWVELVDRGMGILVGNEKDKIVHAVNNFNPIIFTKSLF